MHKQLPRHVLSLKDVSHDEIRGILNLARKIKKNPRKYENALRRKSLLMIFAKPSLRTHLSFDIAMYQLGGHAVFYDLSHSTLGKKESVTDFSQVVSRYVDIVMARLFEHQAIEDLAHNATVPVINGLTDYFHPCQILGDFLTIEEHLGSLEGRSICFVGDANNNVTHSLIEGCHTMGMRLVVSCPKDKLYLPNPAAFGNDPYVYEEKPAKAVKDVDIVYSDSWMSYHIPKKQETKRLKSLKPYQVNDALMKQNARMKFMHCLPATRGIEVTDSVMDSDRSIVYDQAENRMHVEKAILLWAMRKA